MDFIANLPEANHGRRGTRDRFQSLEVLLRKVCDDWSDSITLDQFQKIVKSRNPFFVERVFKIFDTENSNSVSKDEFIKAVKEIVKRSPEEKVLLLFQIYDLDGDDKITLAELRHVIKCCMDENGLQFSLTDLDYLTLTLFEDADKQGTGYIDFDSFKSLLGRNAGLIENVAISVERWLLPSLPPKDKKESNANSFSRKLSLTYIANNATSFFFLVAFILANVILFTTRLRAYRESNYYVMFARAGGQCLNFTCAFTLALMLRKCITAMRSSGISDYLPVDQHIYYHKLTGMFIGVYSLLHTAMHIFNFRELTFHSNVPLLEYLFSINQNIGWFYGSASVTGWLLIVILFIMIFTSMNFVRRTGNFEVFYYCHLLYVPFYLILTLHAPDFWKWLLVPGTVFVVELLIRMKNSFGSQGYTYIQQGSLLPSRVVHLVIRRPPGFDFRPGDWIFVQIPEVAKAEWHPFTISSAPEMSGVLWLHIRAVGEWTNRLLQYFAEQEKMVKETNRDRCLSGLNYDDNLVGVHCDIIPSRRQRAQTIEEFDEIELTPNVSKTRQQRLFEVSEERGFSYARQSSTPAVTSRTRADVKLRKYSTVVDRFPTSLSRSPSKVYVLPRPRECDEFSCKRRSNHGDSEEQSDIIRAKNFGKISSMLSLKRKERQVSSSKINANMIKLDKPLHLHIDGPYGSPSSHIFSTQHAVMIATGIGVTPYASILQSIMFRYVKAKHTCPKCGQSWADPEPPTMMNLKKVDFVWINRDQKSFEWFVNLLSELEITQAQLNEAERFLDMHMYVTSALDKSDMKAIGLQLALDLMHEKEKRDLITGLKTRTQPGRPNWDEFFSSIAAQNKGRVTVFFCGPPELGRTLQAHCIPYGFTFRKENF
ncbi:NADPH oxidase 5 [Halotydeus destructor]|nr:NADPH oxidase 5 [Halotydeus destructor]